MPVNTAPDDVAASEPLIVISSDGHVGALMEDYRSYLDSEYRDEFDEFLVEWREHGTRSFDRPALLNRLDRHYVEEWDRKMVATGRVDGFPDGRRRLAEMEREGVSAEVVFPDFGLPFELYSRSVASSLGHPPLDEEHKRAGFRAFNRWVLDFVSVAPERFVPMAAVSWHGDVDVIAGDIRSAYSNGFRGIVLPEFNPQRPLYHPSYERVWDVLDDLGMIVNTHSGISSVSNRVIYTPGVPHPACAIRLWVPELMFFCRSILNHLIWGGVFERHPNLRFVFTEQGSSWVRSVLTEADYTFDRSYFRTDYHDVIRHRPSEYFERQCYLGSSIFSRAEVAMRHDLGITKMMLGMDFPHHEGTLLETTPEYLRATLGATGVPPDEARQLLGENAAAVFGFDLQALAPTATLIGLQLDHVLTPPDVERFPRGDVHKPAV